MLMQDQLIGSISFHGDTVRIDGLSISDTELCDYLIAIPPDDQASSLAHLIEIGLACLQRASLIQDRDFVKSQLNAAVESVEKGLCAIPDTVKSKLLEQLGTGEGQALYPIDRKVEEVSKILKDRMDDIKKLLVEDIDPQKETSKVAQVFKKLERSLDPEYSNSVPKIITTALDNITGEGGALPKHVKAVVIEAIKPLQDEVNRLGKEILGQTAVEEALNQTIEKGQVYEESVVERLQTWSTVNGFEVHHVGVDNKPGDVLVHFTDKSLAGVNVSIVVETRDRQAASGRKMINDSMERSMAERSADYGIYLSKDTSGLAKEIGDWAEGESSLGSWIATTDEHLMNSIRFLILSHRILVLKSEKPDVDVQSLEPQLERIRTSLKRITNINKKATAIRQGADSITQESENLRDEVRGALILMEDGLRLTTPGEV